MKICFICGEYPPAPHGGIGTMTQVLGRALVRHGHEVRVIGVYPRNCVARDCELDLGVQVWRIRDSERLGSWVGSRYQLYRKVSSWAHGGDVDIVEVPDYHGWSAGWMRMSVPVVTRLHGSMAYFATELHRPIDKIAYWLERSCLRRADFTCSVSAYTLRMTRRLFNLDLESSTVLYNPVDLPADVPWIQRNPYRVIFSGTLTGKKGIVALIKAWPIVVKVHPEARLHIFGKNGRADNGESMESLLSSMLNGTRPTVRFHGHVPRQELFDVYQTAGVAVFPSRAEAFAMAPLEAMASGCPTIYSRRGSGPELLEHGEHGLLIDPDNPEEIADAILRIQADPSFAQQLSEAGRAHVTERFSVKTLTSQNVEFYSRCVDQFRSRRHRIN